MVKVVVVVTKVFFMLDLMVKLVLLIRWSCWHGGVSWSFIGLAGRDDLRIFCRKF